MKGIKFTAREKERAIKMWREQKVHWQDVCKKCRCTRVSLWRWNALYNGTLASLENKPSTPLTPHPNAHTEQERADIMRLLAENPTMGYTELYGELRRQCAYSRHYLSMYKFIRKNALRPAAAIEAYIPQNYETPEMLGVKLQMDVKCVPKECYGYKDENSPLCGQKFYQYTIIDEATRERFIYPYMEQSGWSTQDFIKRSLVYFGYIPLIIQTDNGTEFTNHRGANATDRVHITDKVMNRLKITHQLIRPYTPRHNGKVERSHRTDQERFYNFLHFDTFEELGAKMGEWLTRYNNSPSTALRNRHGKKVFQTPLQKRTELLEVLKEKQDDPETPKIRFLKNSTRAA